MNIIHRLCIHFILLVLTDAVSLKLIPGDQSVVKKDGATHTISKFYVVPDEYGENNVGNTAISSVNIKSGSSYGYSKSSGLETVIGGGKFEAVKNKEADNRFELNEDAENDSLAGVSQADGNANESSQEAVSSRQTSEESIDYRGNLLVESITESNNANNNTSNESKLSEVVEDNLIERKYEQNLTQYENVTNSQQQELKFSDFDTVILEQNNQNLLSFWELFKTYVIIADEEEQVIRKEKMLVLLNIFTNLLKASLKIPIEQMIDCIVDTLQEIDIENTESNKNGSQFSTNYILRCKNERNCYRKHSRNLNSNSVSISESDVQIDNDDVELEKRNLNSHLSNTDAKEGHTKVWIKLPYTGLTTNHITGNIDQHIPIQSQHLDNSNFNYDEYHDLTAIPAPQAEPITNNEIIYEEAPSNVPALRALPETNDYNIVHDWTAEETIDNDLSRTSDDNTVEGSSLDIEDRMYHARARTQPVTNDYLWAGNEQNGYNFPLTKGATIPNILPLGINSRILDNQPSASAENTVFNESSRAIENGQNNLPPIENKMAFYPQDSEFNSVNINNGFIKPYVYAYVINGIKPVLYHGSTSGNIVGVQPETYYNHNFGNGFENGLSFANSKGRVVVFNEPSSSWYKSEIGLSREPFNVPGMQSSHAQSITYNNGAGLNYINSNFRPQTQFIGTGKVQKISEINNNPSPQFAKAISYNSQNQFEVDNHEPPVQPIRRPPNQDVLEQPEPDREYHASSSQTVQSSSSATAGPSPNQNPYYYDSKGNSQSNKETGIRPNLVPNAASYANSYANANSQYNLPSPGSSPACSYSNPLKLSSGCPFSGQKNIGAFLRPNQIRLKKQRLSFNYFNNQQFRPGQIRPQLAPSYQLFSLENLLKLNNALQEQNVQNFNINDFAVFSNLKKINGILLILANYFGKNGRNNQWYENIFYNTNPKHPLQLYVYNLIRQNWLHDLMILLHRNNYNLNILNNPRLFSVLEALQFPEEIQKYLEIEGYAQDNFPNNIRKPSDASNFIPGYYEGKRVVNTYNIPKDDIFLRPRPTQEFNPNNFNGPFDTNSNPYADNPRPGYPKIPQFPGYFEGKNVVDSYETPQQGVIRPRPVQEYYDNNFKVPPPNPFINGNSYIKKVIPGNINIPAIPGYYEGKNLIETYKTPNGQVIIGPGGIEEYFTHHFKVPFDGNPFVHGIPYTKNIISANSEIPMIPGYVGGNSFIETYGAPKESIILGILGVHAGLDANAIIKILQKYLQYKNYVEQQEFLINRQSKIEMLRQIILFLREKGYEPSTIYNLVRKLYGAVYSVEGSKCQKQYNSFPQNMYDIILPALRRSGQ